MTESVTDIIVSRSRTQERWTLMMVGSALAHVALLAIALLLPSFSGKEPVREVMTISIGGAPGPNSGGLTPIGGQAVQEVAPPEPPKRIEPPPAPPKMTIPEETKPRPKAEAKKPAEEPVAPAKATTGPEVMPGSTPVDTGVRGTGFGLSSSGSTISGPVSLDVVDFCCPEYLEQVVNRITSNWQQDQGRRGSSVVRFRIRRDGTIEEVTVDKPSGYYPLDAAAQRAVSATRLPQLPQAFPNPSLTVRLTFNYLQ